MAKVTRLAPRKPRHLSRAIYTERGLRLPAARRRPPARWLRPALVAVPLLGFGLALLASAPEAGETGDYMSPDNPWSKEYVEQPGDFAPYPNCDAARAARAAPVRLGEPGYGPHLDRDGDGVGCEPYRGG